MMHETAPVLRANRTSQLPIVEAPSGLKPRFAPASSYSPAQAAYTLLPFRFIALDQLRYVASNLAGEYAVLPKEVLRKFVRHELQPTSPIYNDLKSKHFLIDGDSTVALDLLAAQYRTKQSLLSQFTSLFMFVVTLRCDHSCPYCQVSRQSADRHTYDMRPEFAERAIDFMFRSPSQAIKVEFQGGEPLLNFDMVREIVLRVEDANETHRRDLQFVIATNLANVTNDMLSFCNEHEVFFSTSLDGPREVHNRNRPRPGGDSYERTVEGIRLVREHLGRDRVAALMTTTEASLERPREIIDEYLRQGFGSIFLRPLSPYGFAVKTGHAARYNTDRWLQFYREALDYIIQLNVDGKRFREEYTTLLLQEILTPFPTRYVDLQSPAGIGISCLVFNYDGAIYASDEARMLAEMGDRQFRLGMLMEDSYEEVMLSPTLIETLEQTVTEIMPMCNDCGFQPYCGSDPVYHHTTQGDAIGFKPTSGFCRKNMEVLRHIFHLLEDDPVAANVLTSWV